jgi:RNA polymerase sigma-B factor
MDITKAARALTSRTGVSPRPAELAEATGLTLEQVLEALEAADAYDALSLDVPRGDGEDDSSGSYADSLGELDPNFARVEYGACIAPAFAALPERERLVVHLRFAEDLTQTEIAGRIGVSQMHVSRLLRRAIERMSAYVNAEREAA